MLEVILKVNRREIDRIIIINDGSGTNESANYLIDHNGVKYNYNGYDRGDGAWELIREILKAFPIYGR
jgi:hypothetical protein